MEIYTIRDIARKAGVGVSTVSRVLNGRPDVSGETREKVLKVVAECGFVQNGNARFLKRAKTMFAAIIVRGRKNLFLSDVAEQMLACAQNVKIPFLIKYIDEEDDEFDTLRRMYAERGAGGFILLGAKLDERSQILRQLDVPCVFATVDASEKKLPNASSVSIDDKAAGKAVMDQFLRNGHTRLAVFGGNPQGQDPLAYRYQGVLESLHSHGLELDSSHYVITRFSISGAYECALRFFKTHQDITAVMAMSDAVAAGIIRALKDLGKRVPEDVAVTGFDGTEMARYFIPSIATVKQPTEEIARESVELLCAMLEGASPRFVTVNYELVGGESAALTAL